MLPGCENGKLRMVWFLVSECMFGLVGFIRNNVSGCITRLSLVIQLILNMSRMTSVDFESQQSVQVD